MTSTTRCEFCGEQTPKRNYATKYCPGHAPWDRPQEPSKPVRLAVEQMEQPKPTMKPLAAPKATRSKVVETPLGTFKSSTEARYAEQLEADRLSHVIESWDYEAIRLKIADDAHYRPDFFVRIHGAKPELREVKGSWKSKNARESRVRLKVAASKYREFKFVAVTPCKGGWDREEFA